MTPEEYIEQNPTQTVTQTASGCTFSHSIQYYEDFGWLTVQLLHHDIDWSEWVKDPSKRVYGKGYPRNLKPVEIKPPQWVLDMCRDQKCWAAQDKNGLCCRHNLKPHICGEQWYHETGHWTFGKNLFGKNVDWTKCLVGPEGMVDQ